MGQKPSSHEPIQEKSYCSICMYTLDVEEFKVVGCGHCFCVQCLEAWSNQNLINCPSCRYEERRPVQQLSDMHSYEGPLFVDQSPDVEDQQQIQDLLHRQLIRRAKTIFILREAANAVTDIELKGAGVKIGGSVAGLVGTGLVVTGGILSLTGVGAIAGVPLAMTGAAIGGVGGLVIGGGVVGEMIAKNNELKGADEHFRQDYFHSMQLRIILGRAAQNPDFAERFDIKLEDATGFAGLVGRAAKVGVATANFVKSVSVGVARGVGTVGLHVAGIVIAVALVPIDLHQLIQGALRIHKKDKAEIAVDLENNAAGLENELIPILKEKNYGLFELERFDNRQRRHCLLLAIDESNYEQIANSNISYESVIKKHVVLLDHIHIGETKFDEMYQNVLDKWISSPLSGNSDLSSGDSDRSENSYSNDDFELL